MNQKNKKRENKILSITLLVIVSLIITTIYSLSKLSIEEGGTLEQKKLPILNKLIYELGEKLNKNTYNYIDNFEELKTTELITIDLTKIITTEDNILNETGTYNYKIKYGGLEYSSEIIVKDKTPPILELKHLELFIDEEINIVDLVESCTDLSGPCDLSIIQNVKQIGENKVIVNAKDKNNNITEEETTITYKNRD